MKITILIVFTAACASLASHFYEEYSERAAVLECESMVKEIGSQLENVKKEYGSYRSGFKSLRYSKNDKCYLIEVNQKFSELNASFSDANYRIYFYFLGRKKHFGKLDSGALQYLERD